MKLKRIRLSVLLTLCFALLLGTTAYAVEVPDFTRPCSITFTILHGGVTPVPGGSLSLYRVGEVVDVDEDYSFQPTGDFAACGEDFSDLSDTAEMAVRLAEAAKSLNPLVTKGVDSTGHAAFTGLELGLYLVVQQEAAPGFEALTPFLVSLPYNDNGHYLYDLVAGPKPELVLAPTPTPTPTPTPPPGIPQTGQLWWPVPVLVCGGLLLVIVGFVMSRRKNSDEC